MIIFAFILGMYIAYLLAYYLYMNNGLAALKECLPFLKAGWVIIPKNDICLIVLLEDKKCLDKVITKSQFKVIKRFLRYHKDGNYYALN